MSLFGWLRTRKTVASATALAVLIVAPVTLAVLHNGFPVSSVNLKALDVWVTNANLSLTARFNTQITELDSIGVPAASNKFDVLQGGDNVFMTDPKSNKVSRVDPALASSTQSFDAPSASTVTYGGGRMAVLSATGALWLVDGTSPLQFNGRSPALHTYGAGSAVAIGIDGTVAIASAKDRKLYAIAPGSFAPVEMAQLPKNGALRVTVVGSHGVALAGSSTLVFDTGSKVTVEEPVLQLQQPGPDASTVLAATKNSLIQVGSDQKQTTFDAKLSTPSASADDVAAPVMLDNCIHGAWTAAARYMAVCDGQNPVREQVASRTSSGPHHLQFRVNGDVIALNDVNAGDVWMITKGAIVPANLNWDKVIPPKDQNAQEDNQTTTLPNFTPQPPKRQGENHAPIAKPDSLGARPGKSVILDVLANDTDEDGDVLTITSFTAIPDGQGTLKSIQNGRALQYTAPATFTGTMSFRYSISDGRGGVADANVNVAVRPASAGDLPPVSLGTSAVTLEVGKTISYNVLGDWYDPDGDDLILEDAQAPNAIVRFSPNGVITYTALGTQTGPTTVLIKVGDGQTVGGKPVVTDGKFIVDIVGADDPADVPITTPDFVSTFVGQPVQVSPLANDLSPSGTALTLGEVKVIDPGVSVTNTPTGAVSIVGNQPGSYYVSYVATAGAKTQTGYIRVDVLKPPSSPPGPTAVRDIAYLRPNEPVIVSALDNDLSPSGAVLGIQSVSVPTMNPKLSVQVLSGALIKITAPSGMTAPVEFSYTISDGSKTSTANIAIVPLPKVTNPQQPVTVDDNVQARVGDVASVNVLVNDYSPDGSRIHLAPDLTQQNVGDGFAFVTGDQVRLQAPTKAGQYSLTYLVTDDNGQTNTAKVNFLVSARDAKNNKAPNPQTTTARVFVGGILKVKVPLDGIDPDGDSVTLTSVNGAVMGTVTDLTSSSFAYIAPRAGSLGGTDTFTYEVKDALGATAQGQVRIGVIPAPTTSLAPDAVDDQIAIRPDRISSVPVLANDSDPSGYTIEFAKKPKLVVQSPLKAVEKGDTIIVTAPHQPGDYQIHYFIDNKHQAGADAYLTVKVDPNAPLQPPVAFDQSVDQTTSVGKRTIKVSVLHDAQNPAGLVADLVVKPVGPNSALAKANTDGTLTVTLGSAPQAIAYQLTNKDHLSAVAIITVPAYADSLPPYLKSGFTVQTDVNTAKTVSLSDMLVVPSGRKPTVADKSSASSPQQQTGVTMVAADDAITFTPKSGFVGNTFLTFKVGDKGLANDPNAVTIQVPIKVGDPQSRDIPPTFANQSINVEVGKSTTFSLRNATSHPNQQVLNSVTYKQITPSSTSGPIQFSFNSDKLTMSVDQKATVPSQVRIKFELISGSLAPVQAELTVNAVESTAPLPQAVDDAVPDARSSSHYTIQPLDNDFNPFAGAKNSPLILKSVDWQGDNLGATKSINGSVISVDTGVVKSGVISLIYTMRDARDVPSRQAQGRITITVTSAPEAVTDITLSNPASHQVAVDFKPPVSTNGAPITGYVVRIADSSGSTQRSDCTPGVTCTFDARQNGASQTVDIAVANKVGTTWSTTKSITPYGTPTAPTNPLLNSNSSTATATITPSWSGPADSGGGGVTYQWNFTQGSAASGSTTGTTGIAQNVGAGDYTFQVRACNAGRLCSAYATSASRHIDNPPPPPPPVPNMTISQLSSNHWIHLVITGYPANTTYSIACWVTPQVDGQNGRSIGSFNITTDGSGGGTWDNPSTCTMTGGGYGNLRSTVVWSNTIALN
ncbi:Ig-like domain-containing protein [Frigoribacterium sp. UYMn621]|uniref:Ig-like domain-containing protein n=1 Tax=Frigoribacterium sp. UYMn621 TaxID=3156343 RepID=UPI00339AE23C